MAYLLQNATTDGPGAGAALTGPCTVTVDKASVFDGATVNVHITYASDAAAGLTFNGPAAGQVVNATGSYTLTATLSGAGTSTSVSVEANQ